MGRPGQSVHSLSRGGFVHQRWEGTAMNGFMWLASIRCRGDSGQSRSVGTLPFLVLKADRAAPSALGRLSSLLTGVGRTRAEATPGSLWMLVWQPTGTVNT